MANNEKYFTKSGVGVAAGIGAIVTAKLINKDVVNGGADFAGTLEWFGSLSLLWGGFRAAMGGIALRAAKYLPSAENFSLDTAGLPYFSINRKPVPIQMSDADSQILGFAHRINSANHLHDALIHTALMTQKLETDLLQGLRGGVRSISDRELIVNVVDGSCILDQMLAIELDDEATPTTVEGEKHWFDYINARVQPQLVV